MKRKLADMLCAFCIAAAVFTCVMLISQADFFSSAVKWNKEDATLEIFDMKFVASKSVIAKVMKLVSFNDFILFDGFSDAAAAALRMLTDYISDVFRLFYTVIKGITGS